MIFAKWDRRISDISRPANGTGALPCAWNRFYLHYMTACSLGTVLIVIWSINYKVSRVENAVVNANKLISAGAPGNALLLLNRVSRWADSHPVLSCHRNCAVIKSLGRMGQYALAEQTADQVFNDCRAPDSLPEGIGRAFQTTIMDVLLIIRGVSRNISGLAGYDILINEATRAGESELAQTLSAKLKSRLPDSDSPRSAVGNVNEARTREWIAELLTAPEVPLVPPASASPPKPVTRRNSYLKWGVVVAPDTGTYSLSGKYLGRLDPGTLVEITSIKETKAGQVAVCKAPSNGDARAQSVLIRTKNMDICDGALADADENEKRLRVREAQLVHLIATKRNEYVVNLDENNPYTAEYTTVKKEYLAFWRKVKDLTAKRDSATGDRHVYYSDQLRMMKGEDVRLGSAFESIKKKYEEWNITHAKIELIDNGSQELQAELANVQHQLHWIESKR